MLSSCIEMIFFYLYKEYRGTRVRHSANEELLPTHKNLSTLYCYIVMKYGSFIILFFLIKLQCTMYNVM